ncbi:MAG: UvrB/UvrC motif-containing protein [Chlamydiia bacterium]
MTAPKKADTCKGCSESIAYTFKQIEKGKTNCIGMCSQCPLRKKLLDQTIETVACPHCKTTLQTVETTKKVGCLHCFTVFKETCHSILKTLNVSEFHPNHSDCNADIQELQASLQEAIAKELFEEAALLRDRLKQISSSVEGA